jgi:hypothetical protein
MKKILMTLCGIMLFYATNVMAAPFDISGDPAFGVDTNPATLVTLSTIETGIITDLNIRIELGGADGDPEGY